MFEERLREGMSETVLVVGVLLMEDRRSESLMPRDRGERVTEPGVMLGSSSIFFICGGKRECVCE